MRRQNDLAIGERVVESPDDIREACHRASNGNRPRSRRPDFAYEQKWRPIEQCFVGQAALVLEGLGPPVSERR